MVDQDIDVASVLLAIKQEISEQCQEEALAVTISRAAAMEQVRATSWVNPRRPIAWPDWPKGLLARLAALAQKLVRRALSWYIEPLVEDQNRFNQAVVAALEALAQENALLAGELRASRAQEIRSPGDER
jgi:hypothetical protein